MKQTTLHSFAIYDESPANIMRHIRVWLQKSTTSLNNFEFGAAREALVFADQLAGELQVDLAAGAPTKEGA